MAKYEERIEEEKKEKALEKERKKIKEQNSLDIDLSKYQQAEEPKFMKFDKVGDRVAGLLMVIEPMTVTNDEGQISDTNRYVVKTLKSELISFLGTSDLNYKIKLYGIRIGTEIVIIFKDTRNTDKGIQKIFEVFYKA